MSINPEWIIQSAENSREYSLGEKLYRQGKVSLKETDSFWRGERMFRMEVKEGEDSFFTSVRIRQGDPGRLTCSCRQPEIRTKLCRHLVAAAFDVEKRERDLAAPCVSTSESARELLNEYSQLTLGRELAKHSGQQLKLIPVIYWKGEELQFVFSFGGGCSGRIRDLVEFSQALDQGQPFKAGRHSIPMLHPDLFDENDRRLARTVKNLVIDQVEFHNSSLKTRPLRLAGDGILAPGRGGTDEIMDCLIGRTVQVVPEYFPEGNMEITEDRPKLLLLIRRFGRDGVSLQIDREFCCASGQDHFYVCCSGKLYRTDRAFMEGAGRLLRAIKKTESGRELLLKERDLPAFYEYYQREIKPNFRVECRDVDLESCRPDEFKAEFYVDCPERNELTLEIRYRYGEIMVSPFDYTLRPDLKRNTAGEKLIAGIVKEYFHARYQGKNCFVIRDNEDEMYQFLHQGIKELAGFGDVYLAERMKHMRLIARPRVSLSVVTRGNWFDLKVDAEGITQEELREALLRYQKKERYIRLNSGDFLELEEKEIKALAELYRDFDSDENGALKIPSYRALYVDNLGEQMSPLDMVCSREYDYLIEHLKKVPDNSYRVPKSLEQVMKDYQKQGFCWMKNLDALGFGGILADDMGLGKTLQAISLLVDEAQKAENHVSLIVCPASLVYNWKHELEMYAPELACISVAGDASERAAVLCRAENYQVLITSYDLLKKDIELYRNITFSYCFLDEAQYIKNHLTQNAKTVKQIRARTRFALTGTPIENRLSELWSIMDFLIPGLLYSYSRFCRELEQPIVRDQNEEALARLRRLIAPFVLRRLKKDVLRELPDKLETVIYTKMEGEQKKLYAANALALRSRLSDADEEQYRREKMQVLTELTKLRQICCDPGLYYQDYQGGSAKLWACLELIVQSIRGGHKILLFSQFVSMLNRIGDCLKDRGIHYYELTGQTAKKERLELSERFNEDDVPVFLISLKAGGTGLNLTAADVVIHYDPWWNIAAQNQATDRAHRLGQKNVVSVFKLITRSTIEENILLLQQNKSQLAEKMMEGGGSLESAFGRDEIIALLKERRTEDEIS